MGDGLEPGQEVGQEAEPSSFLPAASPRELGKEVGEDKAEDRGRGLRDPGLRHEVRLRAPDIAHEIRVARAQPHSVHDDGHRHVEHEKHGARQENTFGVHTLSTRCSGGLMVCVGHDHSSFIGWSRNGLSLGMGSVSEGP